MGEAQYSQGKFNDSAKTFLNAHQAYSKSPKAPEMLLKLGMSLAALDNKDTACATLREVNKRYPKASQAVIASDHGSSPVDAAAHQMRSGASARGRLSRSCAASASKW